MPCRTEFIGSYCGTGNRGSEARLIARPFCCPASGWANRFLDRYEKSFDFQQLKAFRAIPRCRTAALGGHIDACPRCGYQAAISYNSCLMGSFLFWGVAVANGRVAGSHTPARLPITVWLSGTPSTCPLAGTCPCGGEAEPLPQWPPASRRDQPARRSQSLPDCCGPTTATPS